MIGRQVSQEKGCHAPEIEECPNGVTGPVPQYLMIAVCLLSLGLSFYLCAMESILLEPFQSPGTL